MKFTTFTKAVRIHIRTIEQAQQSTIIKDKEHSSRTADECTETYVLSDKEPRIGVRKRKFVRSISNLMNFFKADETKKLVRRASHIRCHSEAGYFDTLSQSKSYDSSYLVPPSFPHPDLHQLSWKHSLKHKSSLPGFLDPAHASKQLPESYLKHTTKPLWSSYSAIVSSSLKAFDVSYVDCKSLNDDGSGTKGRTQRKLRRFTFAAPLPRTELYGY
ncbi:hypothetical protein BDF19DRAFT_454784 [Syncephalis fuscata]|nr:hypothetical protein BDF19DRAFT_454784 [Syncephalis fuscata]